MRHFRLEPFSLFVSEDVHEKYNAEYARLLKEARRNRDQKPFNRIAEYIFACLMRSIYDDCLAGDIGKLLRHFGTESIAILDAHGNCENGTWLYDDGTQTEPVQAWIDRHDGKYTCLIIACCNPASLTPRSRKSLLVIPDRNVGGPSYDHDKKPIFTLIHPQHGEIDSNTMDSYLGARIRGGG